ncbi:MAG: Hsp70 family protein, partial [Desulfobacter sp.]|nr:Hsp70 family protein [Desulfobacter sp.]
KKTLKEHGSKVDEATRKSIEDAAEALKQAKDSDNLEDIKAKIETLSQASHKLAEVMYQQAQTDSQAGQADGTDAGSTSDDDDVVDADFEEVKKDK